MSLQKSLCTLSLVLLNAHPIRAQKAGATPSKPTPTRFTGAMGIIGGEVADQWKGLLPTVNVPPMRTRAFPGQHLTVLVSAEGQDRDQLLAGATYAFTVSYGGVTRTFPGLHPSQCRRIKAEGADFVKFVMQASNVGTEDLEDKLSMVSFALFDLDWQVPPEAKDGAARFQGTVTTPDGKGTPLKDASVEIWTFDHSVKEGDFKDRKAAGEWEMTYYQHPEPARILNSMRLATADQNCFQPNVQTFYVEVLKTSPLAARDLLRRLPKEAHRTRLYALLMLKEAGADLGSCLASLPEADRSQSQAFLDQMPPLPDPYDFSVNLSDPYQITSRMDMLWSIFLATGAQKPVRAIADTLAWRDDGKAALALRKSGKKIDSLSPGLLHGLAYSAGGWSLGSFVRSHGLVADFVEAWKHDPKTPAVIREELGTLITNEAFKAE